MDVLTKWLERVRDAWKGMTTVQQVNMGLLGVVVVVSLVFLAVWSGQKEYEPLVTGVSGEEMTAIRKKLVERGVEHKISDSGLVLVPREKRMGLYMELMGEDVIPKKAALFDFEKLMSASNPFLPERDRRERYSYALSNWLAQTIMGLEMVQTARVLVTPADDSIYLGESPKGRATVMLVLKSGKTLSSKNVRAIANLVSGAVKGVEPGDVEIVDQHGQYYGVGKEGDPAEVAGNLWELRQQLTADVERKAEACLRAANPRVKATAIVKIDRSQKTIRKVDIDTEKVIPTKRTRLIEETEGGGDGTGGPVGTRVNASMSVGTSFPSPARTKTSRTETTEENPTVAPVTETHTIEPPGEEKDVSVSITYPYDAGGKKPAEEELAQLRDHVMRATGILIPRNVSILPVAMPVPPALVVNFWDEARQTLWLFKGQIFLGVLALLSLLMLRSMMGRPHPVEIAKSVAAAAGAAAAEGAEPAMTEAAARSHQLVSKVREVVASDPSKAAGLIKRWLTKEER